ncbi:E3 ubiquitin-protein ligase MARCH6 [Galdieria sulphuraria]|nr:E3 ubiquitin-protein ligase MARCH6 [Galdieria sulphuraria]
MDVATEDEPECRICRGTNEPDRPLFHPCRCSGSIKYIHEDCLVQWLSEMRSERCELCGSTFRFIPVYKQDSPSRLSFFELLSGVVSFLLETGSLFGRLCVACLVWLCAVPLVSSMTFRACLCRSVIELSTIVPWSLTGLGLEILKGYIVCCSVLILFLATASFRSFLQDLERERREEERITNQRLAYSASNYGNNTMESRQGSRDVEQESPEGDRVERALFPAFLDGEREEGSLGAILGITGPLHVLMDVAGSVLLSNAFIFFLFVLAPSAVGHVVTLFATSIGFSCKVTLFEFFGEDRTRLLYSFLSSKIGNVIVGYLVLTMILGTLSLWVEVFKDHYSFQFQRVINRYLLFVNDAFLFVKVVALLIIELGICPFFCGLLIERFSSSLFYSQLRPERLSIIGDPFFSSLIHWFLGVFFTFNTSMFIQTLRTIVRPELLFFFRNPDDPDFHPFRDLVELPIAVHSKQIILSLILFVFIIFCSVFVPTWILQKVYPSLFPFRIEMRDTLTEGPICILLFRFLLPLISKQIHVRQTLKQLLVTYITVTSELLCIKELVVLDSIVGRTNMNGVQDIRRRASSFSIVSLTVRGLLMLFGFWVLFISMILISFIPLYVGRRISLNIGFDHPNDIYHFILGFLALFFFYRFLSVQLSSDETPYYNLFRCCYTGLLIMKSFCKMRHLIHYLFERRGAMMGVEAVEEHANTLLFSLHDRRILLPWMINMSLVFSTVYLLINVVLPCFVPFPIAIQWLDHHIYLILFGHWASVSLSKLGYDMFENFYRRVFDSRYLLRRQLQNFT